MKARDSKGPSSDGDGDGDGAPLLSVAHALRGEGFDASEDGTGRGTPIVPVAGTICRDSFAGGAGGRPEGAAAGHFLPVAHAIQERAVSENLKNGPQGKGWQEDLAYTLEARNKVQAVGTPWAVRRLTPRECERLQGFPDDFTSIPTYDGWRRMDETETPESCEAEGMKVKETKTGWWVNDPDGPRYKALGNSMAVNVMEWLGERIAIVDAIEVAV